MMILIWEDIHVLPNFFCAQSLRGSIDEFLTHLDESGWTVFKVRPLQKATSLEEKIISWNKVLVDLYYCSSSK